MFLNYEGAFIDVRYTPVATKFRVAPKCRAGHEPTFSAPQSWRHA